MSTRSRRPVTLSVDTQLAACRPWVPAPAELRRWARAAVAGAGTASTDPVSPRSPRVCIRVVTAAESRRLNNAYRGRDNPTNVLSFPASAEARVRDGALGDVAICAPVVATEARDQGKALAAHWAHMVVHGVLHLLGHDHLRPAQARRMEQLEVEILRGFGYQNPYRTATTLRA
jgi:probable rRNA maturation factor